MKGRVSGFRHSERIPKMQDKLEYIEYVSPRSMGRFRYLGTTIRNQNYINK
jgi:hypothetical protein